MRETMRTSWRVFGYHGLLVFLYLVCLAGISVSIWAHVISFMGIDPRTKLPGIWIVELALTFSLLPLVVAVFRRGIRQDPLRLSSWSWRLVYVLLAYYAFHFYFFIARASVELTSDITWHMFSAGWILLFALAFVYYRGALARLSANQENINEAEAPGSPPG